VQAPRSRRYASLLLEAVVPPMRDHGFGLEAHGQNMLARFSDAGELVGFAVRDFGGVMIDLEMYKRTTGHAIDLKEGSTIVASSLDEVYIKVFHTTIQNHLHRLIRALDLHHDGSGWEIVRRHVWRYGVPPKRSQRRRGGAC